MSEKSKTSRKRVAVKDRVNLTTALVMRTLDTLGVDRDRFYAAYEAEASKRVSWMNDPVAVAAHLKRLQKAQRDAAKAQASEGDTSEA